MEASDIIVRYTADPNWSNVACVCVRVWGKKRDLKRDLWETERDLYYRHSTHVLSSPLLSSPLLSCRFSTLPCSSLLYILFSTHLCSILLFCALLLSTLIYPSLLYSIECPQHRSFSPNKRRVNNGVKYCENGTCFLVKSIVPTWFG